MSKSVFLYFLIYFLSVQVTFAQKKESRRSIQIPSPICYASGNVENHFTPPPAHLLLKSFSEKKSEIIVTYSLFPEKAKQAFEYAVNIWENTVQSEIPIYVEANWRSQSSNVLGSAGPSSYLTNFKNTPHDDRFYPVAIAEKITGKEITGPSSPDIVADFNEDIDWYFGTDGNTPDSLYDFVTVVLHEIGHGLGFTGFFFLNNSVGTYGYYNEGEASAFDLLVVDKDDNQLVDTSIYSISSNELQQALTSGKLYANSPVAIKEGTGYKPKLYAPNTFDDGSSIYHIDDATYPNNLMNHAIGKAEAIHDPGHLVTGILNDIGWKHMYLDFNKPKDIEQVQPITFNISIESDYPLDSNSLYVYYSTDAFNNHEDSILLEATSSLNIFSAQLTPKIETGDIHYFISASDTMRRIFKLPTEAPNELYNITIGPDTEKPEISHDPIPYFLLTGEDLEIIAYADDNVGIDTVYVEYQINGTEQNSFGLFQDSVTKYKGIFNFNPELLNDGDEITYNITAKDKAVAQNTQKIPYKLKFSFKSEQIFEPVMRYYNDFNMPSTDFVISDFDIYTENNFENGALHSPHPYESPETDDTYWNFTTVLKYPVVLTENAVMSFDEVVLVEPGEDQTEFLDDEFWDYVIVEGSKDFGKTWMPVVNGYDSRSNSVWNSRYFENIVDNDSRTEGDSDWYINREIDLLENKNFLVGDTVLFRFRLLSDPYANGWGWAIDNLRIQQPVQSPITALSPGNISVYPNPFKNQFKVSVETQKKIEELKVDVFNMFGQKVYSVTKMKVPGLYTEEINLKESANGMYLVILHENDRIVYSKKIIKN